MSEFPAGKGKVRIDVEDEGRVGLTTVTAFGDGIRVRLLPQIAADVAQALQRAAREAGGAS